MISMHFSRSLWPGKWTSGSTFFCVGSEGSTLFILINFSRVILLEKRIWPIYLRNNICISDFHYANFLGVSLSGLIASRYSCPWIIICCCFYLLLDLTWALQLSSSNFLRSSGSSRRPAVSSSREPVIAGGDSDPSRARTTDASPGAVRKISSTAQISSPVLSSDQKRSSSSRNPNIKNFESTLKGIEGLHFNDERLHF